MALDHPVLGLFIFFQIEVTESRADHCHAFASYWFCRSPESDCLGKRVCRTRLLHRRRGTLVPAKAFYAEMGAVPLAKLQVHGDTASTVFVDVAAS